MTKKYVLNTNTKKIHHINGCAKSRIMKPEHIVKYYTIEEAKAEAELKFLFKADLCGNCFEKEKKK